MRRRIRLFALAVLGAQLVNAQSPRWQASVPPVGSTGLYRIILSPEFVGRSSEDLRDIRLIDSTGREVPYLFEVAERMLTKSDLHDFTITRNEVVGKQTLLELERPSADLLVDHIHLRLGNAEVAKKVGVTGSDDGVNWYMIKNAHLVLEDPGERASNGQMIALPPTDYAHYRIAFNDSTTAPVRVLGAQWFSEARSYGDHTIAGDIQWTKEDSAGTTRIRVRSRFPITIDRIHFAVSDTQAYGRSCTIVTHRTSTSGHGRKKRTWRTMETLASFTLRSDQGTNIDLAGLRLDTFDLVFDNGDDRPLHFADVQFMQLERTLTAGFQAGMPHALTTGDPTRHAPRYDMAHFREELPQPLGKLVHDALRERPVAAMSSSLFDPSRWWVWGGIIILTLSIGFMAFRMLRTDQKPADRPS